MPWIPHIFCSQAAIVVGTFLRDQSTTAPTRHHRKQRMITELVLFQLQRAGSLPTWFKHRRSLLQQTRNIKQQAF